MNPSPSLLALLWGLGMMNDTYSAPVWTRCDGSFATSHAATRRYRNS